jgi:glycosyltransferase involved in cell wall biosynthesis
MMIKVLVLALYGPLAASHRYRYSQYVSGLAKLGIDVQIHSLLGDEYLRWRFSGGQLPISAMLHSGLARVADLINISKYDLAILQCELFPLAPGFIERAFIRKPYIYDFDDAFYLKYRSDRFSLVRPLLGDKFDAVIAGAKAVTAGNKLLAQYAKELNPKTQYLPTVVDVCRYLPNPAYRSTNVFTIGWIGSPSTAPYLRELVAPLSNIGLEGPIRLVVIGGKAPAIPNVEVIEIEWSEQAEIDLINSFDVGVMPLPDNEWERGKCAFKLIQYMACAVPVVASPVGANNDVVTKECGLMARTSDEWKDALRILRDRPIKRQEMGEAGRARVVEYYSLQHNLPEFAEIITQSIDKR